MKNKKGSSQWNGKVACLSHLFLLLLTKRWSNMYKTLMGTWGTKKEGKRREGRERKKREKEEREGEEREGFGVQPCAVERNHQESSSVLQLFKVIS